MIATNESSNFFASLERVVSKPRIASYKQIGGTSNDALCRYFWNTALCESLYPSFQILEMGFRNALHAEVSKYAPNGKEWLTNESNFLFADEIEAIKGAKSDLLQRVKTNTEDFLVAEMRFGFWTSLLDSRYDRMWHRIIADVFPNMPRKDRTRGEASKMMNTVRRLRNAALHHHSIWHWKDLKQQHDEMHVLIAYICNSLSKMAKQLDRFPSVYSACPNQYDNLVKAISD